MDKLTLPNLIRRYADGELAPEDAARVEAAVRSRPDLAGMLATERRLREQVGRVMADADPVPVGLADRIRLAMVRESARTSAGRHPAALHRSNLFAIAATLALITGVVLIGIFGPSIDSLQNHRPDVVASAAAYAATEHHKCATCRETTEKRCTYCTAPDASRELSTYLAADVCIVDLGDLGYKFIGGGRCGFPHAERAAQLIYERPRDDGKPGERVSIFMVPVNAELDLGGLPTLSRLAAGRFRMVPEGDQCPSEVLIARDARLVFFVVACNSGDYDEILRRIEPQLDLVDP
ncbi:MAG: hypothetical protein KDA25_10080 [Phycisphaerales bacterium]|nr:hypothetical protein [Phycisphaerales bacterium]